MCPPSGFAALDATFPPAPADGDAQASATPRGEASSLLRSTSGARLSESFRATSEERAKINWTTDGNARLSRAVAARRRATRDGGGEGGDGDSALRDHAREAYEELRRRGQLVAVTFEAPSLGLSLVLSKFARTPSTRTRKRLDPPGDLRRSSSSNDLASNDPDEEASDEAGEGRRLVVVENTFEHRGGGVARRFLRPMDELVGLVAPPPPPPPPEAWAPVPAAPGAFEETKEPPAAPPTVMVNLPTIPGSPSRTPGSTSRPSAVPDAGAVELIVDLDPSAFDALLARLKDAPRPLTLVFSRGRCLAAVRRVRAARRATAAAARGAASAISPARSLPTRRRYRSTDRLLEHAARRPPRADAPRRGGARNRLAALLALGSSLLSAFVVCVLGCLDAPMRGLRRRREDRQIKTHRRSSSAPLPSFDLSDAV